MTDHAAAAPHDVLALAHPPAPPPPCTPLQLVILVASYRHIKDPAPLPWALGAHLLSYGGLCAAQLAWQAAAGGGPSSSYVQGMEAASALLRLGALSTGAWQLQRCGVAAPQAVASGARQRASWRPAPLRLLGRVTCCCCCVTPACLFGR